MGDRTDLQEPMPVGAVTREARNFQPHDDSRLAQSDLGNEPLKAFPFAGGLAALTLIVVDDNDAILRPAERYGPATQSVLALGALRVFQNLAQRGLTDIEIGGALEVFGADFGLGIHMACAG